MKNFPRTIATKQDVEALMPIYPAETKAYLQNVLNESTNWLVGAKLADSDIGVMDDTHKVVEVKDQDDVVTERYQYELTDDPNSTLYRMGYTSKAEVEALL